VNLRRYLQPFAHLAGNVFRILPRGRRFGVALRIALAIAPLLRRSRYYQRRPSLLDGPREEALRIVLRTMTRARVEFDPELRIVSGELAGEGRLLILSGHFLLNVLSTRWLFDSGRPITAGLGGPREPMYYSGTTIPLPFVYAGPRMFVQLRRTIAEGSAGFITIEVPVPHDGWVVAETAAGRRYISPAIFTFAERTGTRVIFVATYLDRDGRVTVTFEQPHAKEAAAMTNEFREFLERHAGSVAGV
jgi:hypothetical protein